MPSDAALITELGIRWRQAFLIAEKAEAADPDTASWYPVGVAQNAFLAALRPHLDNPNLAIPPPQARPSGVASDLEIYRFSLLWSQSHEQLNRPTSTETEFADRLLTLEAAWQALADALDTRPEVQGRAL